MECRGRKEGGTRKEVCREHDSGDNQHGAVEARTSGSCFFHDFYFEKVQLLYKEIERKV